MLSMCSALSPKGAGILTSDRNKTNKQLLSETSIFLSV